MITWIILYCVSILIAFGLMLYYDKENIDEGLMIMASVFWPAIAVMFICAVPFYLVKKIVLKLKKMKTLKRMDLSKLDKQC